MRQSMYVVSLLGLLSTACSDIPQTRTSASAAGSPFEELLRIGRAVPSPGETDRVSYADVGFHQAAVDVDVNRDNRVTWAIFDTSKMPALARTDLEKAALAFAAEYAAALGIEADELSLSDQGVVDASGQVAMAFDRKVGGLVVEGAFLQMIFAQAGGAFRLAELVNRTYGDAAGLRSNALDGEPDWESLLGFKPTVKTKASVLFPRETADGVELVQAVRAELARVDTDDVYTVIYDAASGALLQAVDHKQSVRLLAEVHDRSYFYQDRKVTLPLTGATVNGRSIGTEASTQSTGNLSVALSSPLVKVTDRRQTVTFQMNASGTEAVARSGADANVGMPALNTFVAINRVISFAGKHLDTSRIRYFQTPINVAVNVAGSCNAFYNGSISLFAASANCGNMGEVNDVIYHEWGHGLDAFTGTRGGITDSAFSEGIGDIVSAYLTGDSNMGPGFRKGSERGIRDAKNTARFPEGRGEAHKEGTIISGAFWDMREGLIRRYGEAGKAKAEKIFFQHLLVTDSYQQSYRSALRIADDDANPATRGPDHCLITAAFAAHGLATEEQDCRDQVPDQPGTPSKDESLKVMLADEDLGFFTIGAAVVGAKDVLVCVDVISACMRNLGAASVMTAHSSRGDVRLFKSNGRVAIAAGQTFTLLARDQAGNVTGYKSFRLERQ